MNDLRFQLVFFKAILGKPSANDGKEKKRTIRAETPKNRTRDRKGSQLASGRQPEMPGVYGIYLFISLSLLRINYVDIIATVSWQISHLTLVTFPFILRLKTSVGFQQPIQRMTTLLETLQSSLAIEPF